MTTKKIAATNLKTRSAPVRELFLYHRVRTLLHTMRCIAQYEDALCELSEELKGASSLSVETRKELRDILEKIPSHDYLIDLESVKASLTEPESSRPSNPKNAAKSVKAGKNSVAARKKSGRTSSK